jgi:hypothetical protein
LAKYFLHGSVNNRRHEPVRHNPVNGLIQDSAFRDLEFGFIRPHTIQLPLLADLCRGGLRAFRLALLVRNAIDDAKTQLMLGKASCVVVASFAIHRPVKRQFT